MALVNGIAMTDVITSGFIPRKFIILGLKPKARISVVPMALVNGIAMTDVITSGFIPRKVNMKDIIIKS
jgi:phosphosulfolactate phosphohydrolase-like enzyme